MSHPRAQKKERGFFLVLEGLDGAGTTTQAARLASKLEGEGRRAHLTAEPSTGPVGKQIREILAGRLPAGDGGSWDRRALALLFAADRLDHWKSEIEPLLEQGVDVVCDRYILSSVAYQGLDSPLPWIRSLNRFASPADRTFFLRVRPKIALGRRLAESGGGDLFETLPLQERIAEKYEEGCRQMAGRHRIVVVDGEASEDEVAATIWEETRALLGR